MKREFFPSWIRNLGLEPGPFALYVVLMSRRDIKTGLAWPTVKTLMDDTGMSKRSVHRHLCILIAAGYVTRASGNSSTANRYMIWEPESCMPVPAKFAAKTKGAKKDAEGCQKGPYKGAKKDPPSYTSDQYHDQNQYSPNPSEQRNGKQFPILGRPEIESILEGLDLPDSVYGHVHARMESLEWRTPENGSFRSPVSTARFLEGLAERMEVR